jgi:hypothetical protein
VTTRESEWTEEDRAEVLALAEYRASLCPGGCGHPTSETTSREGEGPDYNAKSTTCRACAALLEAQRGADEGKPGPDHAARLWHIEKLRG